MCTISFIPLQHKVVVTFNRDEDPARQSPDYLAQLALPNKTIFYPKDAKSGGSWFTTDNHGNLAVLFNGALEPHIKKEQYRKSRGLLLLEIFGATAIHTNFLEIHLQEIEPFSILLWENKALYQLVWDGAIKTIFPLDASQNHIFSSATIYNKEQQQCRKNWLQEYISSTELSPEKIFDFHLNYKNDHKEIGLLMQRSANLKTISISQAILEQKQISITHLDLAKNKYYPTTVPQHVSKNCLPNT